MLAEFRATEPISLPPREAARHAIGPEDAPHRLVLFWEYQSEYSPGLWKTALELVQSRNDVRLELFQFPISKELNPERFGKSPTEFYPRSAEAVRVAEAARQLGGEEAFWKAHQWLMEHWPDIDIDGIAASTGIDAAQLSNEAAADAIHAAIHKDREAAAQTGATSATTAWLDGRKLPTLAPSKELLGKLATSR
jgi:protein-disulfide isomerase